MARIRPREPAPKVRKSLWRTVRRILHRLKHLNHKPNTALVTTNKQRRSSHRRFFKALKFRPESPDSRAVVLYRQLSFNDPPVNYEIKHQFLHPIKVILKSPPNFIHKQNQKLVSKRSVVAIRVRHRLFSRKTEAYKGRLRLKLHIYKELISKNKLEPLQMYLPILRFVLKRVDKFTAKRTFIN